MKFRNALFIIILLLPIGGCNPFFAFQPTSESILSRSWAPQKKQKQLNPIYCYSTIGEITCYKSPLKGQENRFVGSYENKEVHLEDRDETVLYPFKGKIVDKTCKNSIKLNLN